MATPARPLEASVVEEQILGVFRELLTELGSERAARNLRLQSHLERDLGLGSLERVELLVRLEARFHTRLPDEVAQEAETPADYAQALIVGDEEPVTKLRYRIEQPKRDAPPPPANARTLAEVLRRQAEVEPERVHIHLIEEDWVHDITYGQLLASASEVAAGLRAYGLRRNETVAIMLPTCSDFYSAFFGVMLAGGIAVPIYPPARPDKIEEYVRRQNLILRNAGVRFLISFDRVKTISKLMRAAIPSLVEATTVGALRQIGAGAPPVAVEPSDTGFIQYTSGSTGDPKGVVLTHANLLANVQGIGWAVQVKPTDIGVSWLPLYHDMGLIGSWLFCCFYAVPLTMMSPIAFLSRPERWLWALSDSRATLCPAPNFSYELCARKIRDEALEGLDLTSWRVAINAGEAVLPDTLARFAERFRPHGFRPEAFVPCYGLAESSVALAFPPINRAPVVDAIKRDPFEEKGQAVPAQAGENNVMRFVANGRPLPGHDIRIVDDEGKPVAERVLGRLFFRGPSMTAGYFRNPKATAAIMTEDGWMDSGDLAYWANGEIYVTGRLKDCIIKGGRNIIPQEVEAAAAEVPGVRRGCVSAFGMSDPETGTERLVVAAETRVGTPAELQKIEAQVVEKIDALLGMPPDKVVLVRPHSIPKTSSGKIRRNETRSLYQKGKLEGMRKPPWLQIFRLWVGNLGSATRLAVRHFAARLRADVRTLVSSTMALVAGVLARLLSHRASSSQIVRWAARAMLVSQGRSVASEGPNGTPADGPAVFVANHACEADPLVLAATLPAPFRIADTGLLSSAPPIERFLLRSVVARPVEGATQPAGGTLQQRIRRSLQRNCSVGVLAETPAGAPPSALRFRLDGLHAAAELGRPVVPLAILENGETGTGNGSSHAIRVRRGEPLRASSVEHRDLVELRQRVREEIAKLCG